MKTFAVVGLFGVAAFLLWLPAFGAAPVKVAEVAPVDDLVAEAHAQLERLGGFLESDESYADATDAVKQAGGVLACLGQALSEHDQRKTSEASGPHLRDAGLAIRKSKSRGDAQAASDAAKKALAGEAEGEAAAEYPWEKLIGMHAMMEEINSRNSKLRRALRRLRKPEEESLHANTIAVLTVAMIADTHEVKNAADIPRWTKMAVEYQQLSTQLAAAVKAEDADMAKVLFAKANETCTACHDVFRDAEQ